MGAEFRHVREMPLALTADGDPNTSPPAEDALLDMLSQPPGMQLSNPNGITFYFEALTAAGASVAGTVTWELWGRDEGTKRYCGPFKSGTTSADHAPQSCQMPTGCKAFVRITAVAGFSACVKLFTRAVEAIL